MIEITSTTMSTDAR